MKGLLQESGNGEKLMLKNKYFEVGQEVMTCGINNMLAKSQKFCKEILDCMGKYKNKDWGDLEQEDKEMNDKAIESGTDRIFAAYNTSEGRIYIITEWDRSVTTILFANEY